AIPGYAVSGASGVGVPGSHWRGRWYVAAPSVLGVDAARLAAAVAESGEMPGVYGFLLLRDGYLVEERYWREGTKDKPHNLKSASKSVISALVGIAIAKGYFGLDQPLIELLPQAKRYLDDPVKRRITVRHLLTMTSGLEPTSYQSYNEWVVSRHWIREALERPLLSEPGAEYHYSTANSHLLSAVIAASTGMSTRAFAEKELFGPMGIAVHGWQVDPDGIHVGGNNLSLLPRDMAKFGQLYLDNGRWENRQLVPGWWVEAATAPSGRDPHQVYGSYGYLWFAGPLGPGSFTAVGYGGQYIVVSPRDDVVMVVTSTLESKGDAWESELFDLLRLGVLGSLQDPSMPPPVIAATITANVNLRSIPSISGTRLALVKQGAQVELSGRDGDWVFGHVDGQEGWLHADYIDRLVLPGEPVPVEGPQPVAVSDDPVLTALSEKKAAQTALNESRARAGVLERALERERSANETARVELRELQQAGHDRSAQFALLQSKLAQASTRIRETETLLAEDRARVAELERALSETDARNRSLAGELAASRERLSTRETALAMLQSEYSAMSSELASRRDAIQTLERNLNEAVVVNQSVSTDLDAEREKVASLEARLAAARRDTEGLHGTVARSQAENRSLEQKLRTLDRRRSDQVAENSRLRAELERTETERAELETAFRKSETEIATLEAGLGQARDDGRAMSDRLAAATSANAELEEKLTAAEAERSAVLAHAAELEGALEALRRENRSLDESLAADRARIGELDELLAQTRRSGNDRIAELNAATAEIERLQTALAGEREANRTGLAELDASRERIASLSEALDAARTEGLAMAGELSETRARIEALEAARVTDRDRTERLASRLAESRLAVTDLKAEAKRAEAVAKALRAGRDADRAEVARLERALAEAESTGDAAGSERDTLRAALQIRTREIEQAEGALAEAKAAAAAATAALEEQRTRIATLEGEAATLRAAQRSMAEELEDKRLRIAKLEAMRDEYETRIARLAARSRDEGDRATELLQLAHAGAAETASDQPKVAAAPGFVSSGENIAPERGAPALREIEDFVSAWAEDWSRQDVPAYLSRYSEEFLPADGSGRERWERQRRARLARPAFIEVEISRLRIDPLDDSRARATFEQAYRADHYRDTVTKTLDLIREGGHWRIIRETVR
ncbi:MAG: serine hydrolase, partial [Gammaproteobacteria bacterium]|nr:serine hydrolase [Gammaproteobacteria bacterium]